jgi:hypothetical protein
MKIQSFIFALASLCCCCWLIKGQDPTERQLYRKRLIPLDTIHTGETSNLPRKFANDFGEIVDNALSWTNHVQGINWSRMMEDTSFSFTSECSFDIKLDCFLADDRNVSILKIDLLCASSFSKHGTQQFFFFRFLAMTT